MLNPPLLLIHPQSTFPTCKLYLILFPKVAFISPLLTLNHLSTSAWNAFLQHLLTCEIPEA